jgi:hypothetical protein
MYNFLDGETFDECDPETNTESGVCVDPPTGNNVLAGLGLVYPIIENDDTIVKDIGVLLGIAFAYKIFYILGVVYKTTRTSHIDSN